MDIFDLERMGFTPEEIAFITDPAYAEASRRAKAEMEAFKEEILRHAEWVDRKLSEASNGLVRYSVEDLPSKP